VRIRILFIAAAIVTFAMLLPGDAFAQENNGKSNVHSNNKADVQTSQKRNRKQENSRHSEAPGNSDSSKADKVVPGKGKGLEKAEQSVKQFTEKAKDNRNESTEQKASPIKKDKEKSPDQPSNKNNHRKKGPEEKSAESQHDVKVDVQKKDEIHAKTTNPIIKRKNKAGHPKEQKTTKKTHHAPLPEKKRPEPFAVISLPQPTPSGNSHSGSMQGSGTYSSVFAVFENEGSRADRRLQPYVSHAKRFRNQWVNAPPSPPPKRASFF
jgi:FtsZ-interacting cell division protein ZipA